MGLPVDSNDVEQMLNLYEKTLDTCKYPLTKHAKKDAVVEVRRLFRALVDATRRIANDNERRAQMDANARRVRMQESDPDNSILDM